MDKNKFNKPSKTAEQPGKSRENKPENLDKKLGGPNRPAE
ncbi:MULTISPECIES: spore protein [Bacillaceae]|nr:MULTISPECIES: spore protein [Bacillaceae]